MAAPSTQSMEPLSVAKEADVESQQVGEDDGCCCCHWKSGPPPTAGMCGLPPEERPDLSVWVKEDKRALHVPAVFAIAVAVFSLAYLADPESFYILRPPPLGPWAVQMVAVSAILAISWYPLGLLVWYRGVSVAITRKVTHTMMLTLIPASAVLADHGEGLLRDIFLASVWQTLATTLIIGLMWLQPMRKHFHLLRISFAAIERSEDRPNALLWVLMQSTAMTMVQTPMIQWMLAEQKGLLIWIPFLSVALGDGLAEPIGRMCGKHKYEVTAIGTDKKFTRSYEGSACVFLFTLMAVIIALPEMTNLQAILCLAIIPFANTYAEAKSPHTFDNHIMWGITWLLLWLIFDVLPTQ